MEEKPEIKIFFFFEFSILSSRHKFQKSKIEKMSHSRLDESWMSHNNDVIFGHIAEKVFYFDLTFEVRQFGLHYYYVVWNITDTMTSSLT